MMWRILHKSLFIMLGNSNHLWVGVLKYGFLSKYKIIENYLKIVLTNLG